MTNFIWKGTDKFGKSVVREVMANSIEDSKQRLVSEGCTNLELFQDEIMAAATSGMDDGVTVMGEEVKVTAAQRVEQVNKPPLTIWSGIRQGVGQSKGLTVFMVGLCAFLAYRGYVVSAIIASCALLAWLGFMIGAALANRHDKALECAKKSLEENPTPVMQLELANQLARYHNDATGAGVALREGEKATVPEILKPFVRRIHGVIAYLEKDYASAKTELESSIKMMEATPHVAGRDGNIRVARAYLCCVLVKLGDFVEARKQFEQAKEYLIATKENELLAACEQALRTAV